MSKRLQQCDVYKLCLRRGLSDYVISATGVDIQPFSLGLRDFFFSNRIVLGRGFFLCAIIIFCQLHFINYTVSISIFRFGCG